MLEVYDTMAVLGIWDPFILVYIHMYELLSILLASRKHMDSIQGV